MAGGIWVPINTGLIGEDLAHTVEDAAPAVMIVDADFVDRILDPRVSVHLPAIRFLKPSIRAANPEPCSTTPTIICCIC